MATKAKEEVVSFHLFLFVYLLGEVERLARLLRRWLRRFLCSLDCLLLFRAHRCERCDGFAG